MSTIHCAGAVEKNTKRWLVRGKVYVDLLMGTNGEGQSEYMLKGKDPQEVHYSEDPWGRILFTSPAWQNPWKSMYLTTVLLRRSHRKAG